jgi:hypothetical protein
MGGFNLESAENGPVDARGRASEELGNKDQAKTLSGDSNLREGSLRLFLLLALSPMRLNAHSMKESSASTRRLSGELRVEWLKKFLSPVDFLKKEPG